MGEDVSGQQPKEAPQRSGFLSNVICDLCSQAIVDGLCHLVVGLFRAAGALLGSMLDVLPW